MPGVEEKWHDPSSLKSLISSDGTSVTYDSVSQLCRGLKRVTGGLCPWSTGILFPRHVTQERGRHSPEIQGCQSRESPDFWMAGVRGRGGTRCRPRVVFWVARECQCVLQLVDPRVLSPSFSPFLSSFVERSGRSLKGFTFVPLSRFGPTPSFSPKKIPGNVTDVHSPHLKVWGRKRNRVRGETGWRV